MVTSTTGRLIESIHIGRSVGGSQTIGPMKQKESGQSVRGYSNAFDVR